MPRFLLLAGLAATALVLGGPSLPAQGGVAHVRSTVPLEGTILDWTAADVDGDGLQDLFLARRLDDGTREIHVFKLRPGGAYPSEADHVVDVKQEVVSWGVGDFRADEPGVELLLTTRSAAYTLSPRRRSYKSLEKIAAADLLLDLVSDRAMPVWDGIADVDGDGLDEVVLVTHSAGTGHTGFTIVGADGSVLGEVPVTAVAKARPAAQRAFRIGRATFNAQPLADLLVPDDDPGVLDPPPILYAGDTLPIPFLADADGDGLRDLIYYQGGVLFVHRARASEREDPGEGGAVRFAAEPDLQVPLPDSSGWDLEGLHLVDAGGGPAVDLILLRSEDSGTLTSDWQAAIFHDALAGPKRMSQPSGLIQVNASFAEAYVADLNGDDRRDLAVSGWSLTLSALGIQGVDIEHTVVGHFANDRGGYDKRASFGVYERDYSADDFTAFSVVPPLAADLDGDGLTDLIEPDAHGVLEMHSLDPRRGFSRDPAWTIPVEALTSRVSVEDVNGDGVGDFIVLHGWTHRKPVSTVETFISEKR